MTPPARLAQLLAAARRAGTPFADAWGPAVTRVLVDADADTDERGAWSEALEATRGAWKAAWERRPGSRPERGLRAVADDPDREALPDRPCEGCAAAIPADRDRRVKWCSESCRRAASRGSVRAAAA